MAKISKVNIAEVWGFDELFPILQDAFRVLYVSYFNLSIAKKNNPYKRPIKGHWYLEDIITNDLVKGTIEIEKHFKYRIQKQQEDFETNSKIDIAVLYSLTFDDNSTDLKIECKRLDNFQYIVDDGIKSFKNNKYSEKLILAGMLLYNIQNNISTNIRTLNVKIEKKISSKEKLTEYSIIADYPYTYKSTHKRNNNSDLDLYSCVFDFNELIEN